MLCVRIDLVLIVYVARVNQALIVGNCCDANVTACYNHEVFILSN